MELHIETEINAPAEKVWEILAHQFDDIADWSKTVRESRAIDSDEMPVGFTPASNAPFPGRETVTAVATLQEIIIDYSEENKELTFAGAGLPSFFVHAKDRQRVIPQSPDKCLLTFDVDIKLRGVFKLMEPILKRRMHSTFSGV